MSLRALCCFALIGMAACSQSQAGSASTPSPNHPRASVVAGSSPSPQSPPSIAIAPSLTAAWPSPAATRCAPAKPPGSPALMVVLEAKGVNSGSYLVGSGAQGSHDTVVIADLNAV